MSKKYTAKCVFIGGAGVGKSSLMDRMVENFFDNDKNTPTIGVDFKIKDMPYNDNIYRIQFWDTAGQERFRSITRSYYRNSNCLIICFSLTNKMSFLFIDSLIKEVKENDLSDTILILVGTMLDKDDSRCVSYEEASIYALLNNMEYFEISSKTTENIDALINYMLKEFDNQRLQNKLITSRSRITDVIVKSEDLEIKNQHSNCCYT